MTDGFQLLHAAYAVESFLHRLSRRNCNYHLAFFDQHRLLCIPPHCRVQDEPKYLLARSAIIRHLSCYLAQTHSPIQVLNFSSTKDEKYEEYLERAGIYFIMCHDGAQVPQQANTITPAEASTGDFQPTQSITTQMVGFQLFILRSMLAGYNLALVNSLEWRDTKVTFYISSWQFLFRLHWRDHPFCEEAVDKKMGWFSQRHSQGDYKKVIFRKSQRRDGRRTACEKKPFATH